MKHRFQKLFASFVLFTALTSISYAQHAGDVEITVEGGKIVTNERVYGSDFGETFRYFTDEPGYDAVPGTFAPSTSVGFDILGALKVWNGSDFNTVASPRVLMQFGPTSVLTPTANTFTTGLSVNTNASGEWHYHFGMTLVNSAGGPLPADPSPLGGVGIYLLELQLRTVQSGIESSLPYFFVLNNGESEVNHDAAIAYQSAVVAIPEPGTWALIVCGLGAVGYGVGQKARGRLLPVA